MAAQHVNKYLVAAQFGQYGVKWTLSLETDDDTQHELAVEPGEVPLVLQIVHHDDTLYYDAETRKLSTGWNDPGN